VKTKKPPRRVAKEVNKLSLRMYDVDLRQFAGEEYDRLYKLLDNWSWTISFYPSTPKMFRVTWNEKSSINEVTGIPESAIREVHSS